MIILSEAEQCECLEFSQSTIFYRHEIENYVINVLARAPIKERSVTFSEALTIVGLGLKYAIRHGKTNASSIDMLAFRYIEGKL